jgi:hypothetical protein
MFSIGDLIQRYMQGQFNNHPAMKQINNMLAGKTPEQQRQTLLNFAKSNGIDPDRKIFSEQDLKMLGLK